MKLTDDEIVTVLRCAADLVIQGERYQAVSEACAARRVSMAAVTEACIAVGSDWFGHISDEAKRDALLEAAARIEEGAK